MIDKLVSTDLAALGADSRHGPIDLEATLAATGVRPARPIDLGSGRTLLLLGRLYARLAARAAAGATLLLVTIALLVLTAVEASRYMPLEQEGYYAGYDDLPLAVRVTDVSVARIALWSIALAIVAYVIALRIAERVFDRDMSIDRGHRLVRAVDGWSVLLAIAGCTTFATLIGSMYFTLGDFPWAVTMIDLESPKRFAVGDLFSSRLRDIALASGLSIATAIAIGRGCTHGASWLTSLEHRRVLIVGAAIGCVTLYLGLRFDVGPLNRQFFNLGGPSSLLRSALTVGGVVALLCVTISYTLRRRRRELDALSR